MGAFDRIQEKVVEAKDRLVDGVRDARDRVMGGQGDRSETIGDRAKDMADSVVKGAKELVSEAKQRLSPESDSDILVLLKRDHETVDGLFAQLEAAMKKKSPELCDGLFAQLKYELDTHAEAEEAVFYTALRNTEGGKELIPEAVEEHNQVKLLLSELAAMPMEGKEWEAKLTVLKENVQHHVKEEESEMFSVARKRLGDKLDQIGQRFTQKKEALAQAGKPDDVLSGDTPKMQQ